MLASSGTDTHVPPHRILPTAVPSCSGEARYTVFTDLNCCTCPDHRRSKEAGEACKHRVAVEVFVAKRRAARRRRRAAVSS